MISENKQKCVKLYSNGLELYRDKKFKLALDKFNEALKCVPDDGPSKLFVDRCKFFMDNPVSDDWDGVFTMTTK